MPAAPVPRVLHAVVLVSGGGTTLQNLIDRAGAGEIPLSIDAVVSSKKDAHALERARARGIDAYPCDRGEFANDAEFSAAITRFLDLYQPDLVVMAGFMHLYIIPERYAGRVVNIHPALLPKFGGKGFYDLKVHRAVLAAGEKETGCTVHFCDNQYDHGPILLQKIIPVEAGDTPESLREKVQALEREAYPEAIRMIAGR